MTDSMTGLARRLVVGRKGDGRSVYDERAKAELVGLCGKPGASVSRLAREAGVNANQLWRWVREHRQRGEVALAATNSAVSREAFVEMPVVAMPAATLAPGGGEACRCSAMSLRVQLPNGVVFDLRDVDRQQLAALIEALGRMRCSASTKA